MTPQKATTSLPATQVSEDTDADGAQAGRYEEQEETVLTSRSGL
jgi:hypothetical protein